MKLKDAIIESHYDNKLTQEISRVVENLFDRYFRGQLKDPGKIKNFCTHLAQEIQDEFEISNYPID